MGKFSHNAAQRTFSNGDRLVLQRVDQQIEKLRADLSLAIRAEAAQRMKRDDELEDALSRESIALFRRVDSTFTFRLRHALRAAWAFLNRPISFGRKAS